MVSLRSLIQESRTTLVLAVPLMASQVAQMLLGLVDTAMVGRVGVVPLAACAFANSMLSPPMLIGIGLMLAISVQISQAHGAGRRSETGELLRHGLVLSLVAGTLLALIVWAVSAHLHRFGQPPDVAAEARRYYVIMGVSLLPMLVGMALKQFSEALNHPWPPTIIHLASVPLNAFLNWILIYGNWGAPALGLEGAGWATLIARVVAALACWIYIVAARRFEGAKPQGWLWPVTLARFVALVKIGGPAALTLLLEASAFSLAALMTGSFGAVPLAAFQIAISCAAMTFMLPLGISLATTIRMGQALGAAEHSRLRAIGGSSLALGVGIMALCGLVLAFARYPIARGFVSDNAVIATAAPLLVAAALFQVFDGAQVIASGALRGLADVRVPVIFCIIAYWVVFLPLAWLLAFHREMGALGVWTALIFALATAASLLTARFFAQTRPEHSLL
jgi:multidrug resistance protein, MATE family